MSDVENNEKQRPVGGRSGKGFLPGQSGNPGGRPKEIGQVRDLARQHTTLAVKTLVHVMQHGTKDAARVAAAQALLDRGWGRPQQTMDVDGGVKLIIDLTDPERSG
jgi:hypothetical protein